MAVKQWDNETDSTPTVNVYWFSGKDESYWVVEIDTNSNDDTLRVYLNDSRLSYSPSAG